MPSISLLSGLLNTCQGERLEIFLFSTLHGMEFPVDHMATRKHWADMVLHPSTQQQINVLKDWLKQHQQAIQTRSRLQPGYRAFFYGAPGTGKSLTATLLANELGVDLYKVDLTNLVSEYIGETEKNLELLFNRAEEKGWILFFDEADALFGKRTEVKEAHDRYANLETAYLFQRIEEYKGLVILSSHSARNIDDAFIRRFHSIIHFPLPTASERIRIWENGFLGRKRVPGRNDLHSIAEKYELSPASIIHVIDYVNNTVSSPNPASITHDLLEAIQREYDKEKIDQVKMNRFLTAKKQ